MLKTLLPNTKILANWMGWFEGERGIKHRGGVCRSDDPRTIRNQCLAAKAFGVDGFVIDWYGPNDTLTNISSLQLMLECERQGLEFCLMFDSGIVKWQPSGVDRTAVMKTAIDYARATYMQSHAYVSVMDSKPLCFEFGWRTPNLGLDTSLVTNYPDLDWVSQDSKMTNFNGTFGWVNWFSAQGAYHYLDNMVTTKVDIPCLFYGFNDESWRVGEAGKSVWDANSPARIINHDFGKVFQYNVDAIMKMGAGLVQLVTWNDYDERTCFEPFALALSGLKLY